MAEHTYGNLTDIHMIPDYLRVHYVKLLDVFDNEWKPMFTRFMPKVEGDGQGSKKDQTLAYFADPQLMAKFHDPLEAVQVMNAPHIKPEVVRARTVALAFREDVEEFEGDFTNGVIQKKHAMMVRNLTRAINRTVEWTLTRYIFADANIMNSFGYQSNDRQARADLYPQHFNGVVDTHLQGTMWDNLNTDVFKDLNYLKDRYELMAGDLPEFLVIGRVTARSLEDNPNLLNRLINIKDTTQGVLGSAVQALKIVRVVGQTYKEDPNVDISQEGFPGAGDYLRQTWARLNKIDMMTQMYGAFRCEWGMITNRNLGETRCAWVHKKHQAQRASPTQFYMKTIEKDDPEDIKFMAKFCFTPFVLDWAQSLIIERTAAQ